MAILEQTNQQKTQSWVLEITVVVLYGLLIGLSAQFRIPLAFSPVPITAQTLTVLLAGRLLGAKRGALAALTYLILGTYGLQPFAGGSLFGPTGGYLIGFVAAAYFTGIVSHSTKIGHWLSTAVLLLIGNCIIYLFGLPWLAHYVGWRSVFNLGFYPFIIGDLLKIICAFSVLRFLNAVTYFATEPHNLQSDFTEKR